MADITSAEPNTCAHRLGENTLREEMSDLDTGVDILIGRLDKICGCIINEENAFDHWQEAHWIALRLKADIKRIDQRMVDEDNAEHERQRSASGEQLQ